MRRDSSGSSADELADTASLLWMGSSTTATSPGPDYEALYYTWYHRGQGEDGNYETLPLEWARYRMGYYPYVFYCYYDYQGGYEPPFHFICANEYVVCRKGTNNWYYLNDDACRYLFIDRTPNSVINADGLFHREAVMNFLGIKHEIGRAHV